MKIPFTRSLPILLTWLGVSTTSGSAVELVASDGAVYDSFGDAAAISGDIALAGAWGDDPGSVYLFLNPGGSTGAITESARLIPSVSFSTSAFGREVSLSGNMGLVGAASEAIGSNRYQGAVYLYRDLDTASGTNTQNAKLIASNPQADSYFGRSVSLSGNMGLVGSTPNFGNGAAYVFHNLDTATGTVTQSAKLLASDATQYSLFGESVSLSGNLGLVGAFYGNDKRGAAYVFRDLDTAIGTITQSAKLIASDGTNDARFGYDLSLSGTNGLIGAYGSSGYAGAAYFFRNLDTATGTITQNAKLVPAGNVSFDYFGEKVSLSGDTALVGAWGSDLNSKEAQGAAFLFLNLANASGTVNESVKILASDGKRLDSFGSSVAIDGDQFIIGARNGDGNVVDTGKAYSGSVSSLTTLDAGNASRAIDGISFYSRTDWIIGETTDSNLVLLSNGDLADVTATGKAVYIGKNAGSDFNELVVRGTLRANDVNVGYEGSGALTLDAGGNAVVGGGTGTVCLGDGDEAYGILNFGTGAAAGTLNAAGVGGGTGGGLVNFNHNGTISFNSPLSGNLAIHQISGNTTLYGQNSHTSGTEVTAGTLTAGNAGAFTRNTAYTVNGGTLDLNGFSLTASSLSGTGGTINLRTASLTVDQDTDSLFTGGITGSGDFVKTGGGVLRLSGNHTFTGGTSVTGGALVMNGNLSDSDIGVQAGAILGGNGFLGRDLLNSGTTSPGQSVGTLSVGGNYTQTSGGTLAVEINGWSGQHDRLVISGSAELAGTVVFVPGAGLTYHAGDRAEFLTASNVSGKFSGFSGIQTGTILQAKVVYESAAAAIELVQGSFADFAAPFDAPILRSVAKLLDEAAASNRETDLLSYLNNLPLGSLPAALGAIAPEELSAIRETSLAMADSQAGLVRHRAAEIRNLPAESPPASSPSAKDGLSKAVPSSPSWGSFTYADAAFTEIARSGSTRGYETENDTVGIGLDYRVKSTLTAGMLLAYTGSDTDWDHSGEFDMDGVSANLYGTTQFGSLYFDAMVGGSLSDIEYARDGLLGKAHGRTHATAFNAYLGGGYEMTLRAFRFGPTWSLYHTHTSYDSFREKGSLAPLELRGDDSDSLRGMIGMEISTTKEVVGMLWVPRLNVAWLHEYADVAESTDFRFAPGVGSFQQIDGPTIGRDGLVIGASLDIEWTNQLKTFVGYSTQLARDNNQSQHVSTGLTFSF